MNTTTLTRSNYDLGKEQENYSQDKTGLHNIRLNLTQAESLTAVDSQQGVDFTATVHWVRLEGKVNESQYRDILVTVFGVDPFSVDHDANLKRYKGDPGFKHKAVGTHGQYVCWNVDGKTYEVAVCLTGGWLESRDLMDTLKLIYWLQTEGLRATRLDPAVDDHQKMLDVKAMIQALNVGNFSGFKRKEMIFSGKLGSWDGMTLYLGSRESQSYTRIYETSVKHDYPAYRVECELKGDKARNALGYLMQEYLEVRELYVFGSDRDKAVAVSRMADILAQLAIGQVMFIDKSEQYDNGSLGNCEVLPFWQKLLDRLGEGIKIKVKSKVRSLKKTGDWLLRQVSKWVATIAHGLGEEGWEDFNYHLVRYGSQKMDEQSDMWIAELQDKGIEELFGTLAYD